jgi:hypothetical protein
MISIGWQAIGAAPGYISAQNPGMHVGHRAADDQPQMATPRSSIISR